jgi:hypothetical protein
VEEIAAGGTGGVCLRHNPAVDEEESGATSHLAAVLTHRKHRRRQALKKPKVLLLRLTERMSPESLPYLVGTQAAVWAGDGCTFPGS